MTTNPVRLPSPSAYHQPLHGCVARRDEENQFEGLCPQNLELAWMTEATSSIYATPLITDLFSDGAKDIIVPSFVHSVEVRYRGGNGGVQRACISGAVQAGTW